MVQDGAKIEEIKVMIPPPPILPLTGGERGQRRDIRVANPEEQNKKLIIECFKSQPFWKIDALCQKLDQPRGPIETIVKQLCEFNQQKSAWVLKKAY